MPNFFLFAHGHAGVQEEVGSGFFTHGTPFRFVCAVRTFCAWEDTEMHHRQPLVHNLDRGWISNTTSTRMSPIPVVAA